MIDAEYLQVLIFKWSLLTNISAVIGFTKEHLPFDEKRYSVTWFVFLNAHLLQLTTSALVWGATVTKK